MGEKHFHRTALCNEQLMRIDEVTQDIRKLSTFICLGCGQEMEACLGNKREHYFRHKNKDNCSWETYLHKLSKRVLKERFEQQEQFLVHFNSVNTCEKINSCPFQRCKKEFVSEQDLKEYFDTCEIEGSFRGYRADLLLTHSEHPDRALFLEVAVTHKCEEEKINSGIRIIEIDVTNEQSALLELDENNEQIHFYNFKFNREVVPLTNVERFSFLGCEEKIINRKIETIVCKNINEHLPNALLDIVIRKPHNKISLESLGLAHVMVYGTYVRNCGFCNKRESGDEFKTEDGATYNVTGSETLVGESRNTFDYTLNEGTKAADYKITKVEGTLAVTDEDVEPDLVLASMFDDDEYSIGDVVTITFSATNIYDHAETISLYDSGEITLSQSVHENASPGYTFITTGTHEITEADIAAGGFNAIVVCYVGNIEAENEINITTEMPDPHLELSITTTSSSQDPDGYQKTKRLNMKQI
jgi:hypothetical protein